MSLLDTLWNDPAPCDIWIAARTDLLSGSGVACDPYNAGAIRSSAISISLSATNQTATASAGDVPHGLIAGDLIEIHGLTGAESHIWGGIFTVLEVLNEHSFTYYMLKAPFTAATGTPHVSKLRLLFDEVMRQMPGYVKIHLGPGIFLTRGFATIDDRGWRPKSGQVIAGMGMDVTTIQLVGADMPDEHYHAIGTPINGDVVRGLEICDLTIDANVENQPGRPNPGYANVACGAIRMLGERCSVRRVKVVNWGTKSLKQGCFAISLLHASATSGDGGPLVREYRDNCIEDCIVVQPSKNNVREATALHIGGYKTPEMNVQGFGRGAVIRRNFIDCAFLESFNLSPAENEFPAPRWLFGGLNSGANSTTINPTTNAGTFVGRRDHLRNAFDAPSFVRFYAPLNPDSRWNGFARITFVGAQELFVSLSPEVGLQNDSFGVVMGSIFRGISIDSCIHAIVEQNQIHNCWIGGPYCSPSNDVATEPPTPHPAFFHEERRDPMTAWSIKSLIVRENIYRNVAVGPYFNMGAVTGVSPSDGNQISFDPETGMASFLVGGIDTPRAHHLWVGARIMIVDAPDDRYKGLHEVVALTTSGFTFKLPAGTPALPSGFATYGVACGVDFLVIENNQNSSYSAPVFSGMTWNTSRPPTNVLSTVM